MPNNGAKSRFLIILKCTISWMWLIPYDICCIYYFAGWHMCEVHALHNHHKCDICNFANYTEGCFTITDIVYGPLLRYAKLRVANVPVMPGMFFRHRGLAIPTCITAWCTSEWLTSKFRTNSVAGKTFPEFPAHAQPDILRIWLEAHGTSTLVPPIKFLPTVKDNKYISNYISNKSAVKDVAIQKTEWAILSTIIKHTYFRKFHWTWMEIIIMIITPK